jgi:predicted  nucleic acid-binding Zn-ribbon protein
VNEANSKVIAAERELERRKDSIKTVMKQVAEHEETLRNTTTTIQALGIEGKQREELLSDPTALRLFDLRQKQLEIHAEAKACLLREYAAMVHEAEELNKTREDLDQKQLEKAKHEVTLLSVTLALYVLCWTIELI